MVTWMMGLPEDRMVRFVVAGFGKMETWLVLPAMDGTASLHNELT